ncbi:MAG: hypothetical protein K2W95_31100 [Candidatus Obscuribacterales bacterium]|nr:hypothetical protein [Candidatus Obscuribacterales bacterium]
MAKQSCERALSISKRSAAQKDEQLAIFSDLINIEIERSDFEAAKVHVQEAISIRETLFGKTEAGVVELLQNLALMQEYTGDKSAAKSTMETIADRTRFSANLQPFQ